MNRMNKDKKTEFYRFCFILYILSIPVNFLPNLAEYFLFGKVRIEFYEYPFA